MILVKISNIIYQNSFQILTTYNIYEYMIIILIIIIIFIIIITIMVIIKQPVLNSQFSKPPDKLTTCTEKTTDSDFGPPFNAERYAQID